MGENNAEVYLDYCRGFEFCIIAFLLYQSQKMLRHVQQQQALENKKHGKARQLHPKLQQQKKSQD